MIIKGTLITNADELITICSFEVIAKGHKRPGTSSKWVKVSLLPNGIILKNHRWRELELHVDGWFRTSESISINGRKNQYLTKIILKASLWLWNIVYIFNNFPLQFKMYYYISFTKTDVMPCLRGMCKAINHNKGRKNKQKGILLWKLKHWLL